MKTVQIKPAKQVTLVIGERAAAAPNPLPLNYKPAKIDAPRIQTTNVLHQQTVTDILAAVRLTTDGSFVILKPGTNEPYDHDERPYDDVEEGMKIFVVPNRPDQLGEGTAIVPGNAKGGIPNPPPAPAPALDPHHEGEVHAGMAGSAQPVGIHDHVTTNADGSKTTVHDNGDGTRTTSTSAARNGSTAAKNPDGSLNPSTTPPKPGTVQADQRDVTTTNADGSVTTVHHNKWNGVRTTSTSANKAGTVPAINPDGSKNPTSVPSPKP